MSDFDVLNAAFDAPRMPRVQNSTAAWGFGSSWDALMTNFAAAGMPVLTEQMAMQVAAIYSCINLIAGALSSIPINIFSRRSGDGDRKQLHDDPLWWMLNEEMAPRWNAAVGWEHGGLNYLLHGDMFIEIVRDRNGNVKGLEPHPHYRVLTLLNAYAKPKRLVYQVSPEPLAVGEVTRIIDQDDMIHVPGFGFNGLNGMSPLRYALRTAGGVAHAAQDYSGRFFANNARPDYVLQTDQPLGEEKVNSLRGQIAERNSGENVHKPMVLTNGLKFEAVNLSAEDMQLIATRSFQIEEIARIYGVPPFMIGHNEKTTSWGSGTEAMGTAFVRYTLAQHITKITTELNRKLIRNAGKVIEFDTFQLERADMTTLFNAFRAAIGRAGEPGFMSVEEVRAKLGMNRKSDGDLNPGTPAPPTPKPGDDDASQQTA